MFRIVSGRDTRDCVEPIENSSHHRVHTFSSKSDKTASKTQLAQNSLLRMLASLFFVMRCMQRKMSQVMVGSLRPSGGLAVCSSARAFTSSSEVVRFSQRAVRCMARSMTHAAYIFSPTVGAPSTLTLWQEAKRLA